MAASNSTRAAVWLRLALLLSGLTISARAACSQGRATTLTLTETTQVSSLAEACATYTGQLEFANMTDLVNLTGIERIDGQLKIDNSLAETDDLTLHSSTLQNITEGLLINGPSGRDVTRAYGYLNMSLPVLQDVYSIGVYGPWSGVSLCLDSL